MAPVLPNSTQSKHYQTNQLVKFLHLEAEIDVLMQKLMSLSQRKQIEGSGDRA